MIPKTEKELTPADKERIIKAAGADKGQTIVLQAGKSVARTFASPSRLMSLRRRD
jgi:hypothetical protein